MNGQTQGTLGGQNGMLGVSGGTKEDEKREGMKIVRRDCFSRRWPDVGLAQEMPALVAAPQRFHFLWRFSSSSESSSGV